MTSRLKKILLLLLAAGLLAGVSQVQKALNRDRERLGLTRVEPLKNAPPVLAFTTVALGGFRGLVANALWIRANELQDEDKFFEAMQLADWITKLEPHFPQVWAYMAWNMAYNISVKFKDAADRWRWVRAGFELLRDEGLRYNPNETLIYRELAWIFQHKMGANLDDANVVYKQEWLKEMARVFGRKTPDLDELITPTTDDARQRLAILTNEFKLDPQFMKQVDELYGPLEWRLPEAHAIYWGALGLKKARENPTKVKAEDLMQLRRVIYQSMQLSFYRGRLVADPFAKIFEFGPNLDIVPKVSDAYENMYAEEISPGQKDGILKAHRNFLRDAVYFLYEGDRLADAARWYRYLGEKYPDKILVAGDTNSFPRNLSLDEYAVARVVEDVSESSRDRIKAAIEGKIVKAYRFLVLGEDRAAAGYRGLARRIRESYMRKIEGSEKRLLIAPVEDIEKETLGRLLDPEHGMPFEMRAGLRAKLGMPPESAPVPAATNAPPAVTMTNAPASNR
ncbi:MAG: hypothetical protein MUF81_14230 [Verrucomicrobia bacterium]|jgi:hypothetical protein|nr:hypothetical protein [Verrucomicrobiota bacterium]